jgi:hypothetical protein
MENGTFREEVGQKFLKTLTLMALALQAVSLSYKARMGQIRDYG